MNKDYEVLNELIEIMFGSKPKKKRKRARNKDGHYMADDLSTPDINEAYVGGKAPKKKAVKKKPAKKTTTKKKTTKKK